MPFSAVYNLLRIELLVVLRYKRPETSAGLMQSLFRRLNVILIRPAVNSSIVLDLNSIKMSFYVFCDEINVFLCVYNEFKA